MAVWLVRLLDGIDPPALSRSRFSDVGSIWYSAHIERLAELKVTSGCTSNPPQYCPDKSVTRGQMATFLVRAFELKPAGDFGFIDIDGHAHEDNVNALAAAGITAGCEAFRYCPDKPVTRAQMATFLVRAIKHRPSGAEGLRVSDMIEIPENLATEASMIETTGRIEVPVYICGNSERFDGGDVRREYDKLNDRVARFYEDQSSDAVNLEFVWGGIVSPYEYWSHLSIDSLVAETELDRTTNPDGLDECSRAAIKKEDGRRQVVVLADVRIPGGLVGYAWTGIGPAVQPLEVRVRRQIPRKK